MKVYYLDTCNCDYGCPCQFMAKPTHGKCEGLSAFHIIEGNYGTVRLDGLECVLVGSRPGPIHEGHGKLAFYIDDRADEGQFEALSTILTGKAGAGPFEIYASTAEDMQAPRRARISFEAKGLESFVKVEGMGEAQLEPIRNPVTGEIHRAIIELPSGFEAARMEQGSMRKLAFNDGKFDFTYTGTYGSFQETLWKGP